MSGDRPEKRKQKSIKVLKSHNIRTMEGLPVIESEEEVTLRSKEEVVKRMIGLLLISLYAEGLCSGEKRDEHREWVGLLIEKYDAHDFFTPAEKSFLEENDPDRSACINFSWQYEPLTVMLWALGFLNDDEALAIPAEICDVPRAVSAVRDYRTFGDILSDSVLRNKKAVLDQTDLIYRYDWACVEDRISDPEAGRPEWGIVMERHRALNWLIRYCDDEWDDVSTDT